MAFGFEILLQDLGADRVTGLIADGNIRRGERDRNSSQKQE